MISPRGLYFLKKNQNAPIDLLSIPQPGGKNVKTFRWDHRLQIQNLFMAFKTGSPKVVTLGQQYNIGEKPIVILYTYIVSNIPLTFSFHALECVRRAIWGTLYADDACIVSRSPRGLGRMMAVFVEVFGAFGLTISESKTETMCMPIPRAPVTKIVFNTTGQQYRQTTSFAYLGGTVTKCQTCQMRSTGGSARGGWVSSATRGNCMTARSQACCL